MRKRSPITTCGSLSLVPVDFGRRMHQAAYDALGLPWVYVPFSCDSARLADALRGMRALEIRGFGISMPFKMEILPLLDDLSPLARSIGAVNTVVNDDGRLTGHNTDAEGAARALEEVVGELRGARALVMGAGGAARAVAFGLHGRGATLTLTNRTFEKATALAAELPGASARPTGDLGSEAFDVVVQASSGGMDGMSALAFDVSALGVDTVVMDIVYKPLATPFLMASRERGARTIDGARMLLFQAARQFELYTGREAPLDVMDRVIRAAAAT